MNQSAALPDTFAPVRTENNVTKLYIDGPDCLELLLQQISNARHYINFQIMMFYNDDTGKKIADALIKKAKEGLEVRVMTDVGMSRASRAIDAAYASGKPDFSSPESLFENTPVKFLPSDNESYWQHNWPEVRAKLLQKGVPEEFLKMQDVVQEAITFNATTIDHRKILVFDGVSAIVTGMNVGDKYLYPDFSNKERNSKGLLWHDGALLLKGPCVSVLNRDFAAKWMVRGGDVFDYRKHFRTSERYGTDVCTVYSHFPGLKPNPIQHYFLYKVKECKGTFIIENPYINDNCFWDALSRLPEAQAKKIILINPYKAKGNDYLQNASSIQCKLWQPFKKGVRFYSYANRMTHIKLSLDEAENEVFFGSHNLNHRSSLHDFEVNVLVESRQLAQQARQILDKDMADSTQLTDQAEFFNNSLLHPSCYLLYATQYFE